MDHPSLTKTTINLLNADIYCEYLLTDKPAIIFIHGFVASSYTFRQILPELSKHFSVVAIDLPGFGRSEKTTAFTYSYANYAKLIMACIRYFNLDNVCLAGHSMGGQIALYTARQMPNNIRKLVLLNSSAYLGKAHPWLVYGSYLPFFHIVVKYIVQKGGVKATLNNVLYDQSLVSDELIKEYGRPLKEKGFYKTLVRFLRQREGDLDFKTLQNIHIPALLIWGESDSVVPVSAGKQLAKDLPEATIKTYRQAGHLITEERPEEIVQDILNWCST